LAGPFPAELQNDLVFVGAVAADSKEADAAEAFITYLKAAAVFKAKGVKPRLGVAIRKRPAPNRFKDFWR
jgi:molybdate transport system substrate-binding protein